jgi:hypothetical protein
MFCKLIILMYIGSSFSAAFHHENLRSPMQHKFVVRH